MNETTRRAWIGSGDGDCAPAPSHTTGHTVFRIRRLEPGDFTDTPQDSMAPPTRSVSEWRSTAPCATTHDAPYSTLHDASRLHAAALRPLPAAVTLSGGRAPCANAAKSTSACVAGSNLPARKTFRRSWASRYYPHQPTTYRRHSSRNSRLVTRRQLRQISRTFCLNRATLCGATSRCPWRLMRNPRNFRSQGLPAPLLTRFTRNRRCLSIQSPIPANTRFAAALLLP